jgi:hypothetical protein
MMKSRFRTLKYHLNHCILLVQILKHVTLPLVDCQRAFADLQYQKEVACNV